jgi:ABC-type multidrug transport system permease subunit
VARTHIALAPRDRVALISLFALPIVFMGFFGAMFSDGDDSGARLGVTQSPSNPIAARAGAALRGSGMFQVVDEPSIAQLEAKVAAEELTAGLVLGDDLDPAGGHPAVLIIDPGAAPQVRGPIEGALQSILRAAVYGKGWTSPMLTTRSPAGMRKTLEDISGFQVSVPANAVLFGFFIALTCALSFVEERRSGTFRRVMAAPVSRPLILLSKLVPFAAIGAIQMTFLFGVGVLLFGLRIGGSVIALVALTGSVVLCATALGLLIASLSGTEKQIGGIGSTSLLIMGLAGGAMFPRMLMPPALQSIGLVTPHAWALDGYFELLVRDGAALGDVAPQIGALLGFAVLFATVGAMRFRFER